MILLTVFTPAYNRAHTLPRTYKSLVAQDCKEFIWLIIDDGSTDGTAELIKSWQSKDNGFEIQYIYKENGGMHTAHNMAYEHIHTELNVCIDSDDCLAEGAVKKILKAWKGVRGKGYAGLIGLDADFQGQIIGQGFKENLKETTLSGYYASGGTGDKKLVYRTDIINQYPSYPVFEGEKYVALAYKYTLIDQDYKLAVIDEVLCNVEYQENGSTGTMWKQYMENPKGFAFWRKVCMQYPTSRKRLFVDCIHYVSSSMLAHDKHFIAGSPKKMLTLLAAPFGAVLTLKVKRKARKKSKFSRDFYRMTGIPYSVSLKNFVIFLTHHNLRFMYLWRKNEKRTNIFTRWRMHMYTRKYGLEISPGARIGEGLYLGHPYNITVAEGVKMGKNINLHKGCTIGRENRGKREGVPWIGNCVSVGINATVVGKICIGSDVMIAPNSFVNFDVPDHSVVIGNPGRIHRNAHATEGYVNFRV